MLTDLKAKAFDVLLGDDFSRLSRDSEECEKTRKRVLFHGARLIAVSDGIDTDQTAHKLQVRAKGMTNEVFLDQLKAQIKRGMVDQAKQCFWNGGRVYGYKLVEQRDPTKSDCYDQPKRIGTQLQVDEEQAQWVRWIFERYAEGWSALTIVTELNRLNVPPPGAAYKKRRAQANWNFIALHGELERGTGILNRHLYRGVYLWNCSYKVTDPDKGTTTKRWQEKSEWIERAMPELRIVSDDLWNKVHARRVAVSQSVKALRAAQHCRARSTGRRPKYLLSGLLICGVCQKPFIICHGTGYACSTATTQGQSRCTNTLRVERTLAEAVLLAPIQTDLFTDEGYELFRHTFLKSVAALQREKVSDQGRTQKRLAEVEQEITHIMEAIKRGIFTPTTKAELEKAEAERDHLRKSLEAPAKPNGTLPSVLPNLLQWFKRSLGTIAMLGPHEVDQARGIIRDLVGGSITLQPTQTSHGQALVAHLKGNYLGLARHLVGRAGILGPVNRISC
jgi:site-specific DNA recombinase